MKFVKSKIEIVKWESLFLINTFNTDEYSRHFFRQTSTTVPQEKKLKKIDYKIGLG